MDVSTISSTTPVMDADHQKLRKATRQMEGYFVGTLLRKMHESAAKGSLMDGDSASATYREMFDQTVADEIGARGALGLGDMLYKELALRLDGKK